LGGWGVGGWWLRSLTTTRAGICSVVVRSLKIIKCKKCKIAHASYALICVRALLNMCIRFLIWGGGDESVLWLSFAQPKQWVASSCLSTPRTAWGRRVAFRASCPRNGSWPGDTSWAGYCTHGSNAADTTGRTRPWKEGAINEDSSFFFRWYQGCQMVDFRTKIPNLGISWGLGMKMMVYFMTICNMYFAAIWYIS
jgi:hypothetical protein